MPLKRSGLAAKTANPKLSFRFCNRRNLVAGVLVVLQGLLAFRCFAFEKACCRDCSLRLAGAVRDLLDAVLIPAIVLPGDGFVMRTAPHNRRQICECELVGGGGREANRIRTLLGYNNVLNRKNASLRHL